jgi:hypothetical protein
MRDTRDTIHVTRTKDERFYENCLLPCFSKKNSFIIWGEILGSTGEKLLVIWEKQE